MKRGKSLIIGISALLLGVVLVLAIHGDQTLALFSDRTTGINSGKAGSVTVEVTEQVTGLMKENIGMKNTGDSACYVRMRVEVPNEAVTGGKLTMDPKTPASDKWKKSEDGYFYYHKPLEPYQATSDLYNSIGYSEVPEGVSLNQLQIVVYGEAIQSAYVDVTCTDGCVNSSEHAFRHLKQQN